MLVRRVICHITAVRVTLLPWRLCRGATEYSLAALIHEFEMEHGLPSLDPHECEAVMRARIHACVCLCVSLCVCLSVSVFALIRAGAITEKYTPRALMHTHTGCFSLAAAIAPATTSPC